MSCQNCIHATVCSTREHWCDDEFSFEGCTNYEDRLRLEKLVTEHATMKRFLNGEWVDSQDVQDILCIDFTTGIARYEFCRTAKWNKPPLNGQNITTMFRLKTNT